MISMPSLVNLRGYALYVVLGISLLSAQTSRQSAISKLTSDKVTGTHRYTPDEVIAATALQPGEPATEDDFKKAAEQLGESGAFADVAYSFQSTPTGTKLEFQVTDAEGFVPARFDNFVWYSDSELLDRLHARVPLFHDQLPVSGTLVDQVSDALQALLIEHNVIGRADYLRSAHEDGPIEAFIFSVTGPNIRIRDIEFAGASPAELPLLQASARKLQGQDYLRSILRIQADKNFLPVFLQHGYLKAAFSDPQPKVVQETAQEILVDVIFPVDPDQQFKVTEIQLSGNKAVPTEKIRALIHQQLNEPADAVQLASDAETVKQTYATRGYMAATVVVTPEMDVSAVRYLIELHEGDIYRMGELEILGVDPHVAARLVEAWRLRSGDPYNSAYAKGFPDDETKPLLPSGGWKISLHESLNDKDKTVDVTVRFDPKV
jgi:outer membrane protein assembly factor BamA